MGVVEAFTRVREIITQYNMEDVYNPDEFGLFYNIPSYRTIEMSHLAGRKQERTKITGLGCCKINGTRKVPTMFIGKIKKLRCFNKMTGEQLGFGYNFSAKAWMKSVFFCLTQSI